MVILMVIFPLVILSISHFANQPFCQMVILSNGYFVIESLCHIVIFPSALLRALFVKYPYFVVILSTCRFCVKMTYFEGATTLRATTSNITIKLRHLAWKHLALDDDAECHYPVCHLWWVSWHHQKHYKMLEMKH